MNSSFEQEDLRVRRTHKLLWEALLAELAEQPFEEITIKDICERAMVHRTTFYRHYEDKYALLEDGTRRMVDALLPKEEHMPPHAFSVENPPPYFVRLFEDAARHQQFYRLMLCGEGIGWFQKLVKDYIVEIVSVKAHELAPRDQHLSVPPEVHAQFVAGAALSLLAWWLENDMPFSPQQMAGYLLSPYGTLSVNGS